MLWRNVRLAGLLYVNELMQCGVYTLDIRRFAKDGLLCCKRWPFAS